VNGILWLFIAYRAFDVIYFLNILNLGVFMFTGTISFLVPFLTLLCYFLELYLQRLLRYHDVTDDNMDKLR